VLMSVVAVVVVVGTVAILPGPCNSADTVPDMKIETDTGVVTGVGKDVAVDGLTYTRGTDFVGTALVVVTGSSSPIKFPNNIFKISLARYWLRKPNRSLKKFFGSGFETNVMGTSVELASRCKILVGCSYCVCRSTAAEARLVASSIVSKRTAAREHRWEAMVGGSDCRKLRRLESRLKNVC
jgi:hypothetical protein